MVGSVSAAPSKVQISEDAAIDIVDLLVRRGYFHNDSEPLPERAAVDDFSEVLMQQTRNQQVCSPHDNVCNLISTRDECFITRSELKIRLSRAICDSGGRLAKEEAALALAVDPVCLDRLEKESDELVVIGNSDEFLTSQYFDELASTIARKLVGGEGLLLLSELSHEIGISLDMTREAVVERLQMIGARLVTIGGNKVLVTKTYEANFRAQIKGAFRTLVAPTLVESLSQEMQWDTSYVLPVLKDLCHDGSVDGELRDSQASSSAAMYVPLIYLRMQRKAVDELFESQGYITSEQSRPFGISPSNMGEFVKKSFPNASVLNDSVISESALVPSVLAAVQQAIEEKSFVDLTLNTPVALLDSAEDANAIFDLACSRISDENPGILAACNGDALFVSSSMIQRISKVLIPPLVEDFARNTAKQMDEASAIKSEEKIGKFSRDKRKAKRSTSKGSKPSSQSQPSRPFPHYEVVPLADVVSAIVREYPDLAEIQQKHAVFSTDCSSGWEDDVQSSEDEPNIGPIHIFCRKGLYTAEFREACSAALKAEVNRIVSARKAISLRNRKDGAARIQSIEGAFEDPSCFQAACFQVQVNFKFLEFLDSSGVDEQEQGKYREEFLRGCCTDFARRITQYCLFKYEVDGVEFSFQQAHSESDPTSREYCQPVDQAIRHHQTSFLSCVDAESGDAKHPLKTFRKVLPSGIGAAVTQLWTLCGKNCYEGESSEDIDLSERESVDNFIGFLEENCLTICGLPFRKLDKKAEKQYMNARRRLLALRLASANEPADVLELSIMLVFQQLRGLVVQGLYLCSVTLDLLCKERKMPAKVASDLRDLAELIKSGSAVSDERLMTVKDYGLSKDISKHLK